MADVSDRFVVDAIATYLGTNDDWSGADALPIIANLIGMVRPHPGDELAETYPETFRKATGREISQTYDMTPQH